jgi:hypothetical protein
MKFCSYCREYAFPVHWVSVSAKGGGVKHLFFKNSICLH